MAVPVFVSVTNSADAVNQASVTTSVTVSAGSNRLLVVAIAQKKSDSEGNVTGVTYGGNALTKAIDVVTGDPFTGSDIWYYIAPTETTADVVVSWSPSPNYGQRYSVYYITGAHQTTPINATNTATGSSTTPSVSVTSTVDDCLILDCVCWGNSSGLPLTVGSGQTERAQLSTNALISLATSTESKVTAGAVTMDWSAGGSRLWSSAAMAIAPAAAASGHSYPFSGKLLSLLGGKL